MEESKNVVTTTIACPHCGGEVTIERPAGVRRGQLLGIELKDMTLEQLRREKINASSVLYKAQKRNAPADLIARNQARVDAVNTEIATRFPEAVRVAKEEATPATTEGENAVYNEEVAGEV